MKQRILFQVFFIVLLTMTLLLVSCGEHEIYMCRDGSVAGDQVLTSSSNTVFVCPDGSKVRSVSSCTFDLVANISQDDANEKATSFVSGYTSSNGWLTKFVNSYQEDGDWYAQLVLSKYDEQAYETTVKIDGEKGVVVCIKNCNYVNS